MSVQIKSNEIPYGWTSCNLHECVEILDSQRIPVNHKERLKRKGNIPYYGATGQVGWINDYIFDEELLLLGEDGAPFLDMSKPIAYIINGKSWVNNHAHVLRAISGLTSNGFLKHYLNQFDFSGYVTGTTRLKLNQSLMKEIKISLPPFNEQRHIVAKLDQLSNKVKAVKKRLDKIHGIIKRFRQSILVAACSGQLTTDWRKTASQEQKTIHEPVNPKAICKVDEIFEVPDYWRLLPLQALCDPGRAICYGVIKLGETVECGIPCLRTSDVKPLKIDISNVKCIANDISCQYRRTLLQGGEVLVNVRGTLGGVVVVPDDLRGWNISREVALVPVLGVMPKYVAFWIASLPSQNWLNRVSKGVAYTGINIEDLRLLPISLPSISEQQEIVHCVEALFKVADQIEERYTKAKTHIDKLTQSILAKAFRGELVPQDPNDESASELLRRIREERTKNQPQAKQKRTRKRSKVQS